MPARESGHSAPDDQPTGPRTAGSAISSRILAIPAGQRGHGWPARTWRLRGNLLSDNVQDANRTPARTLRNEFQNNHHPVRGAQVDTAVSGTPE
jgi:hypothetical protein